MASNFIVKCANKFPNLPGGLVKAAVQLEEIRQPGLLGNPIVMPTALDNMESSKPFLQTLSGLPIAPAHDEFGIHTLDVCTLYSTTPSFPSSGGPSPLTGMIEWARTPSGIHSKYARN
jgi:hypothetical protein